MSYKFGDQLKKEIALHEELAALEAFEAEPTRPYPRFAVVAPPPVPVVVRKKWWQVWR